jgi:hypothetical protein
MGNFPASETADVSPSNPEDSPDRASGSNLPDPPVVVDFSSQIDSWSRTQPALLQAAQVQRLPLVLSWGRFGHTIFGSHIAQYPLCQIALAYPWLQIRKNQAYPVFTHASSNQHAPWTSPPEHADDSGLTLRFRIRPRPCPTLRSSTSLCGGCSNSKSGPTANTRGNSRNTAGSSHPVKPVSVLLTF